MNLYERLFNDTYGASAYNRFVTEMNYINGRDREIAVPKADAYIKGGIMRYQEALNYTKSIYQNSENPENPETRLQVAGVLAQLYPDISFQDAYTHAEDYMYRATGYKASIDSYWEHLSNVFHSTGSGMMAGIRAAMLFIQGGLEGFDSDWQTRKMEVMNDINTRYAMNYKSDDERFNDNIFKEAGTAMAALAPSMLASMGMSAVGGLLTMATGGGFVPTFGAAIAGAGGRSLVGNLMAFSTLTARYGMAGLMDAGGTMIEMANAGFSDDVVLGTGMGLMVASGVLEGIGDPAVDMMLRPFTSLVRAFGKKQATQIAASSAKAAIRKTLMDIPKTQLKSTLGESTTEVLQEFSGMFGFNMALNIEKSRKRIPEDVKGYTADDYNNAMLETIRQTALGTIGMGLVPGTANFLGSYVGGDIRRNISASRFTTSKNADHITSTKNIILDNVARPQNVNVDMLENTKTAPVEVIRIGDRFYPVNVTNEQAYALRNSSRVYTRNVSISAERAADAEISLEDTDIIDPAKLSTINSTILNGLKNNAIKGFSYYDADMNPIADSDKARYVAIVPSREGMNPVIVPISDTSETTVPGLEADVFGVTFTKSNNKTDQTSASAPRAAQASPEINIAQRTKISEEAANEARQMADNIANSAETSVSPIRNTTEARARLSDSINEAANKWDEIKNDLSGDRSHDIDSIASFFSDYTRNTMNIKKKHSDIIGRVSAEIAYGFAKASGMPVTEYFSNLRGFVGNAETTLSDTDASGRLGWFERVKNTADYYINIMRNARPTTISHELSHHFLSTLPQNSELYSVIRDAYSEQFSQDGNAFGTNVQEAFAKDLERYIYHRQSANTSLNKIFKDMFNILQSLYKTVKSYYGDRLDPDKTALFDIIFDDDVVAMDSVTDAEITKSENTQAPASAVIEKFVPDEGKRAVPIETTESVSSENSSSEDIASTVTETPSEESTEAQDNTIKAPETEKHEITKDSLRKSGRSKKTEKISDEAIDKAIKAADAVEEKAKKITDESSADENIPITDQSDKPIYTQPDIVENAPVQIDILSTLDMKDFTATNLQSFTPEALPISAETATDSINELISSGKIDRVGDGRYFVKDENAHDALRGIVLKESQDSPEGSSVAVYTFAYKTNDDRYEGDGSGRTGIGTSYILKLDDGSYRKISVYEGKDLDGSVSKGTAKTPRNAFGLALKDTEGKAAGWKERTKKNTKKISSTEISQLPQTASEIRQGEKPQTIRTERIPEYTADNTGAFTSSIGSLKDFTNLISRKTRKLGNMIPKQIKEITDGDIPGYIRKINDEVRTNSKVKIISMATSPTIYENLSNIFGVEVNANNFEFFCGDDGSIIIRLKADIRMVDGKPILIEKNTHDRWYEIPFSDPDTGLGVADRLMDLDAESLVRNETTTEEKRAENNRRQSEYRDRKEKANSDREIKDEGYADENDEDDLYQPSADLILKNNFMGYSNPSVYSLVFSDGYAYQGENRGTPGTQNIFFSSDEVAANDRFDREYAADFVLSKPNSELFNAYTDFQKFLKKTKDEAEKIFIREEREITDKLNKSGNKESLLNNQMTEHERLENAKNEAVALATGATDPDLSEVDLFTSWLMNNSEYGRSPEFMELRNGKRYSDFENIMNYISAYLVYANRSYNGIARKLRAGITNEKMFPKTRELILSMFDTMSRKSTRKTINEFVDALVSKDAKDSARKIFDSLKPDNKISLSDRDITNVINAMIDDNGNVANVQIDNDGNYYSPLIEICNYFSRDSMEDASRNESSIDYADDDYLDISVRILESLQPDVQEAESTTIQKSIRRLINIFRKNNLGISTIFGKQSTPEFIEALILAVDEKIRLKQDEAQRLRESNNKYNQELTALRAEQKTLEGLKDKVSSITEKYKDNNDELRKKINELSKENKVYKSILEKSGGIASLRKLSDRIAKLGSRINALTEEKNAIKSKLLREIEIMKNSPEYRTAQQLIDARNDIIESINKNIRRTDARIGANLAMIFDQLRNLNPGEVINLSLMDNQEGYGDVYSNLRDYLIGDGIISIDGTILKRFAALNLVEIGEIADVMNDIARTARKAMRERNKEIDAKWEKRQNAIIEALPKVRRLMQENGYKANQIDDFISSIKHGIANGSAIDRQPSLLRSLSSGFIQIENQLRNVSPELHAILFGGYINGEYVEDNLNTAYNQRQRFTIDRKKKLSAAFERIFGDKAGDLDIMFNRRFNNKRTAIDNITVEEFMAKHGIESWGDIEDNGEGKFVPVINNVLPDYLKPIARMILKNEADYKNTQNKINRKAKRRKKYDPSTDLADAKNLYESKLYKISENSSFTEQQVMGIYINAMQGDGRPLGRMLRNKSGNTNNISIGQVLRVFDMMETKEWNQYKEFSESMQEIVGERFDVMADIVYRTENRILPFVNRYFPMITTHGLNEQIKEMTLEGGLTKGGKIRDNFIHDRTNSGNALNLDAVSTAVRAIEAQENFIAFKELSDRYKSMFADKSDMSVAMSQVYGEKGKQLMNNLNEWTNRIIETDRQAPDDVNSLFAKLRHNMVVSVLWGNISSMLQQFGTVVIAARYAGFKKTFEWLFRYWRDRNNLDTNVIYRLSPQMEARMMQETADYRAYTMNRHASNWLHDKVRESNANNLYLKSHEVFDRIVRWGLAPMEFLDRSIANASWLAIFDRYSADYMDSMIAKGMSQEQATQAIADMATQTVLSTQTSQQAKDNALFFSSNNQLLRSAILFTSQLNKQFNMMYSDVNAVWETYLNERDIKEEGSLGRAFIRSMNEGLFGNIMLTCLVLGLASSVASAISGRMFADNEDDDEWYDIILNALKTTSIESINMVPFGQNITDVINGVVYYDTNLISTINNLRKVAQKKADERTPHQFSRAVISFANEFSQLAGVPIIGAGRKIFNGFTDSEMEFNPGELVNSATGDWVRRVFN